MIRGRAGIGAAVVALTLLGVAGCGGDSLGPDGATLSEGTPVSAQRYLADSDGAAATISAFSELLEGLGPVARPAELRDHAQALTDEAERARALAARLAAQRPEDARLEEQRREVTPLLERVVAAMDELASAAQAGDAAAAALAAGRFSEAVAALRDVRAPD